MSEEIKFEKPRKNYKEAKIRIKFKMGYNLALDDVLKEIIKYRIIHHAYNKKTCSINSKTNCTNCNICFEIESKIEELRK